ncbi:MAG: MarR family transcriptional regulator [Candidatus Tantalella remota]|nr:MarR family transcriptional regulator [Candidatus Tantalella remota]
MAVSKKNDFGVQMANMLPALLREVTRKQENIFTKGNLSVSHIIVLDMLLVAGSASMSDIAKVMNLSMASATGIIDKMIEQGFVKRERSTEDRRVVKVSLLKKGKDISGRVNESRVTMTNDLYSVLTDAERDEYLRLLRKVYDSIKG